MRMLICWRKRLVLLASLLTILWISPSGLAQVGVPNDPPDVMALRRFESACDWMAGRSHAAILCEGEPFVRALPNDKAALLAKSVAATDNVSEQVAAVARAYDYEPQKVGKTALALLKRYTNAADLPQIPFRETALRLRRLSQVCQKYNVPTEKRVSVAAFWRSLSEAQRTALAGENGCAVSELDQDHQGQAANILFSTVYSGLGNVSFLSAGMSNALSHDGHFGTLQELNASLEMRSNGQREAAQETPTFAGLVPRAPGKLGIFFIADGWVVSEPKTRPKTMREGLPPTEFRPDPYVANRPAAIARSLRDVLNEVEKQPQMFTKIQLDDDAASHVLYVAGLVQAAPIDAVNAAALCCDLRAFYGLSGSIRIGIPTAPFAQSPSDIAPAASVLLPGALFRALTGAQERTEATTPSADVLVKKKEIRSGKVRDEDYLTRMRAYRVVLASKEAVIDAGVRRLRTLIEPSLLKAPNRQMPVKEASDEALRMVAFLMMTQQIDGLSILFKPVPECILHLSEGRIFVSKTGERDFSLKVLYKNPQGKTNGFGMNESNGR